MTPRKSRILLYTGLFLVSIVSAFVISPAPDLLQILLIGAAVFTLLLLIALVIARLQRKG